MEDGISGRETAVSLSHPPPPKDLKPPPSAEALCPGPGPGVPKIDHIYNDSEADLDLISSDGVIFLVMRYHLQSASPIFRQALLLPPPASDSVKPLTSDALPSDTALRRTLELTDSTFETGETLRHFLQLLDGSWKPKHGEAADFALVRTLFAFADKWECQLVVTLLTRSLLTLADHNMSAVSQAFSLAAQRGETGLCADLISYKCGPAGKWDRSQSRAAGGHAKSRFWVLDPAGMGPATFEAIPPLYIWALTRVFQNWREDDFDKQISSAERRHGRRCECRTCKDDDTESNETESCDTESDDTDRDEHEDSSESEDEGLKPRWTEMGFEFTKLIHRQQKRHLKGAVEA